MSQFKSCDQKKKKKACQLVVGVMIVCSPTAGEMPLGRTRKMFKCSGNKFFGQLKPKDSMCQNDAERKILDEVQSSKQTTSCFKYGGYSVVAWAITIILQQFQVIEPSFIQGTVECTAHDANTG